MKKSQHYDRLVHDDFVKGINTLEAIANSTASIENYAIKMFYLNNKHKFFTCTSARVIEPSKGSIKGGNFYPEVVELAIEGVTYSVNTRNGKISELKSKRN